MSWASLEGRLEAMGRAYPQLKSLLPKLGHFVREASDTSLERINVLGWAKGEGVSEGDALDLFLCASHAGIFDLAWNLMCPACGLHVATKGALQQLERSAVCNFCRRPVTVSLDDTVEASFTVAEAVRRLPSTRLGTLEEVRAHFTDAFYSRSLIRGPMHQAIADSMECMAWIAPEASAVFDLELTEGSYALVGANQHAIAHLEAGPGGAAVQSVEIIDGHLVGTSTLATGKVRLTVRNRTRHPALMLWSSTEWAKTFDWASHVIAFMPFVSAKQLLTNQTFRELYRAQSVGTDGGMQLRSLAILFTDLTASTELYERVGDLQALALVRRHFEVLESVIARERGAVVKTIGDAVMAIFAEPSRALAAAAAMHEEMAKLEASESLTLKIGVHVGSCVAIESNQQLDYFGRTVNVAARVQARAGPGEVVTTQDVFDHPAALEIARTRFASSHSERLHLKGIEGEVLVHRLRAFDGAVRDRATAPA